MRSVRGHHLHAGQRLRLARFAALCRHTEDDRPTAIPDFPVRAPGADVPGRPDPLPGMPQCVHPAVQPSSTSAVRRPSGTAASPARPAPLHALWEQSQANLTEVLGLRTNAEISRARQRIADYPRRRSVLSDVAAVHATVESGTAVGEVVIDVS